MKIAACLPARMGSLFSAAFAALFIFASAPLAWAVNSSAVVQYNPTSQGVSGALPYVTSYTLTVQPPSAMTTFPTTVTIRLVPTVWPIGDAPTAASYVTFSATTLTFTSATQVIPVTVTMNFPATALQPGVPSGAYNYTIFTDGWPTGFIDRGSSISSSLKQPVALTGNPPVVTITTPASPATVSASTFPANISFQFQAATDSSSPLITGVGATIGFGANVTPLTVTSTGIGSASASASGTFTATAPGVYTLQASATNDVGSGYDTRVITVTSAVAPPNVVITTPTNNQVFTLPVGSSTMPVNYSFTATGQSGSNVDSVSAALGSTPLTPTTTGTGMPSVTASGTLTLGPGTYTLTATGTTQSQSASTTVTFSVRALPTVVITSPPAGYTATLTQGGTLSLLLNFTGTSQTPGAVITALAATCDGLPLAVSSASLNQPVATGLATIAVTTGGVHHIIVTATDLAGTGTAARDFTVSIVFGVTGTVYFDLNGNGAQDGADFGLAGIMVKLLNGSNHVVSATITDAGGGYSFTGLNPGSYTVRTCASDGLKATTPTQRTVTILLASAVVPPIGYQLDFDALQKMHADGKSLGFWKNNVAKALAGRTNGVQVSAATLGRYTTNIADFALTPFDGITMSGALDVMSSTSSHPADLLAKQLLPAEYNYQNAAYLNGNATLTFVFMAWGESVLQNASSLSSSYVLWVKDWFDAYNNSDGDRVDGPDPLSGSCTGDDSHGHGKNHGDDGGGD